MKTTGEKKKEKVREKEERQNDDRDVIAKQGDDAENTVWQAFLQFSSHEIDTDPKIPAYILIQIDLHIEFDNIQLLTIWNWRLSLTIGLLLMIYRHFTSPKRISFTHDNTIN